MDRIRQQLAAQLAREEEEKVQKKLAKKQKKEAKKAKEIKRQDSRNDGHESRNPTRSRSRSRSRSAARRRGSHVSRGRYDEEKCSRTGKYDSFNSSHNFPKDLDGAAEAGLDRISRGRSDREPDRGYERDWRQHGGRERGFCRDRSHSKERYGRHDGRNDHRGRDCGGERTGHRDAARQRGDDRDKSHHSDAKRLSEREQHDRHRNDNHLDRPQFHGQHTDDVRPNGASSSIAKWEGAREKPEDAENKYGLLTKRGSADQGGSDSHSRETSKNEFLGPRPEVLARKAEREQLESAARLKPKEDVKQLTEEERLRRLNDMQSNADVHDDMRVSRLTAKSSASTTARENEASGAGDSAGNFLHSMRSEVYNTASISMEDRISQNKHYTQRGMDLDSASSFMRK